MHDDAAHDARQPVQRLGAPQEGREHLGLLQQRAQDVCRRRQLGRLLEDVRRRRQGNGRPALRLAVAGRRGVLQVLPGHDDLLRRVLDAPGLAGAALHEDLGHRGVVSDVPGQRDLPPVEVRALGAPHHAARPPRQEADLLQVLPQEARVGGRRQGLVEDVDGRGEEKGELLAAAILRQPEGRRHGAEPPLRLLVVQEVGQAPQLLDHVLQLEVEAGAQRRAHHRARPLAPGRPPRARLSQA
mmetsp:Transcript_43477/g.128642  ORF Transcript_43477/g.128642 Transcript_43477/m.128642 type:complete len:242 (+) Transcript_43477:347-1072(+)